MDKYYLDIRNYIKENVKNQLTLGAQMNETNKETKNCRPKKVWQFPLLFSNHKPDDIRLITARVHLKRTADALDYTVGKASYL